MLRDLLGAIRFAPETEGGAAATTTSTEGGASSAATTTAATTPDPGAAASTATTTTGATETATGTTEAGTAETKPAVASWPDDWREKLAAGDDKFLGRLKRFASPDSFAKSWVAAQQKLSSGELRQALPEGATPEQVAEWRQQNGVPADAKGYFEGLPEGVAKSEEDKAVLSTMFEAMHGANMTGAQAKATIEGYYKLKETAEAAQAQRDAEFKRNAEDELRAEWPGADFRRNVQALPTLLNTFGNGDLADLMLNARLADGTPLGNHPAVMRWAAVLNAEINPAHTVVPSSNGADVAKTIGDELAGLTKMMGDRKSDYWRGANADKLQARFRDLVNAQQKMKARAA